MSAFTSGLLLNPDNGLSKLVQVYILPPAASSSVCQPVPIVLQTLPVDSSELPPSFAAAVWDHQKLETLPELLDRLNLESTDSLRKYTKKILHEILDGCKVSIQGRSREDTQLRLGILDDQWRDGKLSEGAKIKLGCLASALKNNDLKQADGLHLALMVDHISEVSQWMVGVKRIISELRSLHSSPRLSFSKRSSIPLVTTASNSPTEGEKLASSVQENGIQLNTPREEGCLDKKEGKLGNSVDIT